jgi:hypothetical protein
MRKKENLPCLFDFADPLRLTCRRCREAHAIILMDSPRRTTVLRELLARGALTGLSLEIAQKEVF